MSRRVRVAWGLVFAATLVYVILCQRACMADKDGCQAAMIQYDGFLP